jgi:hypothetical protein
MNSRSACRPTETTENSLLDACGCCHFSDSAIIGGCQLEIVQTACRVQIANWLSKKAHDAIKQIRLPVVCEVD